MKHFLPLHSFVFAIVLFGCGNALLPTSMSCRLYGQTPAFTQCALNLDPLVQNSLKLSLQALDQNGRWPAEKLHEAAWTEKFKLSPETNDCLEQALCRMDENPAHLNEKGHPGNSKVPSPENKN